VDIDEYCAAEKSQPYKFTIFYNESQENMLKFCHRGRHYPHYTEQETKLPSALE
jgi:hypothetical protein